MSRNSKKKYRIYTMVFPSLSRDNLRWLLRNVNHRKGKDMFRKGHVYPFLFEHGVLLLLKKGEGIWLIVATGVVSPEIEGNLFISGDTTPRVCLHGTAYELRPIMPFDGKLPEYDLEKFFQRVNPLWKDERVISRVNQHVWIKENVPETSDDNEVREFLLRLDMEMRLTSFMEGCRESRRKKSLKRWLELHSFDELVQIALVYKDFGLYQRESEEVRVVFDDLMLEEISRRFLSKLKTRGDTFFERFLRISSRTEIIQSLLRKIKL